MEPVTALIEQAHKGDKEARDRLVENNMGLIWSIVRRFMNRGYEPEDLFQIGSIGLLKAIDKFDTGYDVKFSTYAVPMITGEIKRFLRDDGMLKVSRTIKENAVKIRGVRETMSSELNREPTIEELSRKTGISKEDVVLALDSANEVESLHKTVYQGDGSAILLMDRLEENRNDQEELLNRLLLEELLKELSDQERELITLRYFEEKTQSDIAKRLGISQVQVSRMEKRILTRLRLQMTRS
ncbi:MAG: RNA polymerase sporulation sigma factor SigF [Oscillospiraceae bacterium]|nr:RNA polymerase sporulation sigma factor SigF [Oscillospiraceae bacterium]